MSVVNKKKTEDNTCENVTETVTNQSIAAADQKKSVTISRVLVASTEEIKTTGEDEGAVQEDVAAVHAALMKKNLHVGTDSERNIYGAATVLAVRHFQSQNGLNVDGKVGKETAAALGLEWSGSPEK